MITPSFGLTATERVLPKLALDFITASLDSRITFTRTTGASNPATYVNSSGFIAAATNDQPRFDYDPVTLACKGLLIEESRTNVLSYSDDINNASWTKANSTVSANATSSPDGSVNADALIPNVGTAEHSLAKSVLASLSTTYTHSIYVKNAGYDAIAFRDSTYGAVSTFTLSTQSYVKGAQHTCTITNVGNGWYRCTVTVLNNTATMTPVWAVNSYPTSTGDGTSGLYIWGVQSEVGAFATSYIPTTTTALTRNADVATMTGTNFSDWFNASEGTFVAQYIPKDPAPSNARGLFIADDGTGNNLVGVSVTTNLRGILSLATGGSGAGAIAANSGTVNQVNTVAGAYKVNDYAAALNGGTVGTSTSLTLPAVTQARIGFLARTGLYANATIQKLAFYPVRGINAQVQAQSK